MTSSSVFKIRLIPREEKFFDDFVALSDRIVSGATVLERMLSSDPPSWDAALQIRQIEQECDSDNQTDEEQIHGRPIRA